MYRMPSFLLFTANIFLNEEEGGMRHIYRPLTQNVNFQGLCLSYFFAVFFFLNLNRKYLTHPHIYAKIKRLTIGNLMLDENLKQSKSCLAFCKFCKTSMFCVIHVCACLMPMLSVFVETNRKLSTESLSCSHILFLNACWRRELNSKT